MGIPARATAVKRAGDPGGRDDLVVTVATLLERLGRIAALIDTEAEAVVLARLRATEPSGPLGTKGFVAQLEALMRRTLRRHKPGRKAKADPDATADLFAEYGK